MNAARVQKWHDIDAKALLNEQGFGGVRPEKRLRGAEKV